ncbi:MAG: TULIP family P47-like protein [Pseudomonadota bacterium]
MTRLYGWDTVSVIGIDLVNQALAKSGNQLITEFEFKDEDLNLSGQFGAWQIAPGGTLQRVNLTLPIKLGKIEGWLGDADLAGITLNVRVILRLLPSPEAPDEQHLVFDLEESFQGDDAIEPISVEDPDERLSAQQQTGLRRAVAWCLSAHSAQVSFVFASVKARGTVETDTLATDHHDWMLVNTVDDQQYLVVLGAMKRPVAADAFDTSMLSANPSAVLAVSKSLLVSRFLLPTMRESFKPKSNFVVKGDKVVNAGPIRLPRLKKGIYKIDLTITSLTLTSGKDLLLCNANVEAPLKFLATFYTEIKMRMPVTFDKTTGRIVVKPDPNPEETHTIKFPKILDFLIGWLVRWIMSFFDDLIKRAVVSVATGFERLNSPQINTVKWTGIRDFKTGAVALDGNIVLSDTRPLN